jgi:hypothetical protein
MSSEKQRQETMEAAEQTGSDPWVLASAGSVVLSWFLYFVAKRREAGLFVGLWAPTIVAFASYFRQTRMHDAMQRSKGERGMMERVGQKIQGR